MLKSINPILPMRNKTLNKDFYLNTLGFEETGDCGDYLMLRKDTIEIYSFSI
ncbi:VOC family protein [Maribacter antarcticus]|uniref:hypothetical protein n=1 Tax=Maribacter antarcticus TaxID=505250 RepID=UPI000AB5E6D9|nr:hypothetical protein [Maribacter antarcticus]